MVVRLLVGVNVQCCWVTVELYVDCVFACARDEWVYKNLIAMLEMTKLDKVFLCMVSPRMLTVLTIVWTLLYHYVGKQKCDKHAYEWHAWRTLLVVCNCLPLDINIDVVMSWTVGVHVVPYCTVVKLSQKKFLAKERKNIQVTLGHSVVSCSWDVQKQAGSCYTCQS